MLLAGAFLSVMPFAVAQEERPQIMPGERRHARKKDTGPRALGIIQLGKNGKASIIPVAILVNGKFWDASAYKADPVPMALDSGVVYEGERSGNSLGLFTVGSALHSNNPNAAMPWLGTGVWRPNGTEAPETAKKAESAPAGISGDEGPPRLTRDTNVNKGASGSSGPSNAPASPSAPGSQPSKPGSSSGDEPPRLTKGSSSPDSGSSQGSAPPSGGQPAAPAAGSPSSSNGPSTQPSSPSSSSDGGPPRLNRRDSSAGDSGSSQNPAGSSPSGQSKPSDSQPSDSKAGDASASKKSGDAAKDKGPVAPSDSGAAEANRPRLRRGKPAESFADEGIPGYSLPGVRPANSKDAGKLVETSAANKEDVQLIPAVSDESDLHGTEPKSFTFEWIPGEEADRRKQMVDLAKDQVKKYVEARLKNSVAANATVSKAGKKLASPKTPDPELENMQMVAYDLWNTNQPVLVLSAQAHMPAKGAETQADSDMQYSIVLVAYPDIYHNLHKQFVSITDKFHLDVAPRLELIDAVDADGDGTGELLFRETSDQGSGWVVYRAGADKLVKAFDSLNPE